MPKVQTKCTERSGSLKEPFFREMKGPFLWRIGNAPMRRLLARGNTSPYTTFDNFFSVAPRLAPPPALWPQTHPGFLACGVGRMGAAPSTHQDQGLVTSRVLAKRLPLAPVVPQKTVSALPRPIVDCAQMPWLPEGAYFPMAHGRGVA